MSDLAWAVTLIGGFVLVALVLRVAAAMLEAHDDDPKADRLAGQSSSPACSRSSSR